MQPSPLLGCTVAKAQRSRAELAIVAVVSLVAVPLLVNIISAAVPSEIPHGWLLLFALLLIPLIALTLFGFRRPRPATRTAIRRIAATRGLPGQLQVFATSSAGAVLHREFKEGRSWSGWTDLGFTGGVAWDVSCTATGIDATDVFVADSDGAVWVRSRVRATWTDWRRLDAGTHGGAVVALAAASGWSGHREIFAVGQDSTLRHRWRGEGQEWSDWHPAHRPDCVDVASCSPEPNRIDCFALDRQGAVWQRWYADHRWSTWEPRRRPGSLSTISALAAASGSDGHTELFAVDSSGSIAHRWKWTGQDWSEWTGMPRPGPTGEVPLRDVAAAPTSSGRMELLASDDNGEVWQRSYRPAIQDWTAWSRVPGSADI